MDMDLHIFRFIFIFIMSLQLVCCGDSFPSRYIPALPDVPAALVSLLGEPHWRLEWLDSDGREQIADILPGSSAVIELPATWTNPVTAWPYWPGSNLIPGHFKPAGALFPFDASGEHIRLSWEGGRDAVFYRELALAGQAGQNSAKMPAYFDWPRFRSLFRLETLNQAVRKDPWLVDWRYVAEKTVSSSFDQRRLVPEAVPSVSFPVPAGLWYGASPFAEPLSFEEGGTPAFPVRSGVNVWVSAQGILRFTDKTYVFTEFVKDR